jgi:hypothetical protein
MQPQINEAVKGGSFLSYKEHSQDQKYIGAATTELLIHSFVSSRLHFCNSLLYGLYLSTKLKNCKM